MRTLVGLACLLAALPTRGVPAEKWVQTTRADFEGGKAEGTAVGTLGQVALAPELRPVEAPAVAHIWALAPAADDTVYAATGMEPQVLRLRGEEATPFFKAPHAGDLEVLAAAVGPDGAVLAAAAPSGTVYRIRPDGQAEQLCVCPDPYVWALAVAPDRSVLAATGPKGKLLRIAPDGTVGAMLDTPAHHVLGLLRAPDGSVFAGTGGQGLLFHVTPQGAARVVYDASESDLRALALGPQGRLYFATASTAEGAAPARGPSKPSGSPANRNKGPAKPAAPGAQLKATNALYRLDPDGTVSRLLATEGVAYYALAWHDGALYAGTGNDGKLFGIRNRDAVQLADLEASQIMAFAVHGGRLLLATANPGRLFRMTAPHGPRGTLLSEVYDTASLSQWGRIAWQAQVPEGASLTLATRTGNTTRPDATWSGWSEELAKADGQPVPSPPARFIQYRATLVRGRGGASPVLDEVVVAYLRPNEPPQVLEVQIGPPPKRGRSSGSSGNNKGSGKNGGPGGRAFTTGKKPASPQRGPFAGTIRIAWKAEDPNKDDLSFAVHFRGEDETTWKRIAAGLTENHVDWDTESVPDGPLRFRVVVTDAPANPPDRALQAEHVTEACVIDNTPPTLGPLKATVGEGRRVTVTTTARDKTSRLDAAERALDGGAWTPLGAADGLFDAATERITFHAGPLKPGEHTLVVRVRDAAGNSGAAKAVLTVK